ncbi:hypothetical protein [Vallitalea maricola]|uniref:Uncharacterized protein n=1 Tax=Vallitalea maricola TaxID=3074433 RepID=A0ACB5UIM0_9FIRM|nr:hypothetical protein AN2V17_09820 [Vallitalea sp. AN17-2]
MIIIYGMGLFAIIYLAVRLAIRPLIPIKDKDISKKDEISVIDLKNLGLFDNEEMEEILILFQAKGKDNKNKIRYEKYLDILIQLKNLGYLNEEQLQDKINQLKDCESNNFKFKEFSTF